MADTVIKTIFQFRRGLSTTWVKNNPILEYGEPGFEKDTYRLKIGDGVTPWNNLAYFGGSGTIEADGESVTVVGGKVSLYGFAAAGSGFLAMKGADGSLTWTNKISVEMLDVPEDLDLIIEDKLRRA